MRGIKRVVWRSELATRKTFKGSTGIHPQELPRAADV